MRPFSRNIVHYNWHWHWDYGNGDAVSYTHLDVYKRQVPGYNAAARWGTARRTGNAIGKVNSFTCNPVKCRRGNNLRARKTGVSKRLIIADSKKNIRKFPDKFFVIFFLAAKQ